MTLTAATYSGDEGTNPFSMVCVTTNIAGTFQTTLTVTLGASTGATLGNAG